jgi:bifunctional NMN adenylyltransferase/nudix hydrolase
LNHRSLAICIGRFQPVHLGHIDLIQQALQIADEALVIIGSSFQTSSPRNPFDWQLRQAALEAALPADLLPRVQFHPLRDFYDTARWANELSTLVQQHLESNRQLNGDINLIGRFSVASVGRHPFLSQWKQFDRKRLGQINSTKLRDWLFSGVFSEEKEFHLGLETEYRPSTWLHPSTAKKLSEWKSSTAFRELADEWLGLHRYKRSWESAPYTPIMVTADAVLRCRDSVLLIRRGRRPGKGLFALPGGFVEPSETVYDSAIRELAEETALNLDVEELERCLRDTAVFDHPDRSQRGRVITHAFYFDLGDREFPSVAAGDDADATVWTEIRQLKSLETKFHDDHYFILDRFLKFAE